MRKLLPGMIAVFCFVLIAGATARGQSMNASSIPDDALMQPATLDQMLEAKKAPVVLQVGSHVFFDEAHIAGAAYAGPAAQAQGLANLDKAVAHLPKGTLVVLYCGCCPWSRCPNIAPAWKHLRALGYTHVKALYLAHNFGDDWVAKGYPTER